MDVFSEWLVSLKVTVKCPWCLEYVPNIESLWKRNGIYLTLWRVLQLVVSQTLVLCVINVLLLFC